MVHCIRVELAWHIAQYHYCLGKSILEFHPQGVSPGFTSCTGFKAEQGSTSIDKYIQSLDIAAALYNKGKAVLDLLYKLCGIGDKGRRTRGRSFAAGRRTKQKRPRNYRERNSEYMFS